MEEKVKTEVGIQPLEGDYVVVDKQDASSKRGVLFVEARMRDDVMLVVGVSQVRIGLSPMYTM
jgi:hypothetical protein